MAHFVTVRRRKQPMPSRAAVLGDGTIGGEESLRVPGDLNPLQAPLALAGGLVRVLGTIVHIAALPVLHPGQGFPLRGARALQLISDEHPWPIA
jgi:hypothetical protein